MEATRVLVVNELRSYREAIAQALESLRPAVEALIAEPEDLDREVARLRPDFVICSRATPAVESRVPVWVELHPNCGTRSRVGVRGETASVEEVRLDDLLALLDRTRGLGVPG